MGASNADSKKITSSCCIWIHRACTDLSLDISPYWINLYLKTVYFKNEDPTHEPLLHIHAELNSFEMKSKFWVDYQGNVKKSYSSCINTLTEVNQTKLTKEKLNIFSNCCYSCQQSLATSATAIGPRQVFKNLMLAANHMVEGVLTLVFLLMPVWSLFVSTIRNTRCHKLLLRSPVAAVKNELFSLFLLHLRAPATRCYSAEGGRVQPARVASASLWLLPHVQGRKNGISADTHISVTSSEKLKLILVRRMRLLASTFSQHIKSTAVWYALSMVSIFYILHRSGRRMNARPSQPPDTCAVCHLSPLSHWSLHWFARPRVLQRHSSPADLTTSL